MSIRVAINLSTVRRASEETIEYGGYCWEGRLLNAPEVEGRAKHTEEGNPIREISLSLRNDDEWIDTSSDQLWETVVTVAVTGVTETWTGKVRSWSQDGHGILTISAAEDSLAVFKRLLPDEVVRFSDSKYTNASRGAAGVTIPTVFGGTAGDPVRVKATLTDRVNFRYIVCVGEISQVVAVRKNGTVITTGFTSYTGASGQGTLPGFAYIEFAADPRDEAGTWPDILVDVVGLLSGERNPAKIIKAVLTTADSGPCGWGLGISASDLDTASFTQAETDCASAGFLVDGAFIDQRKTGYWLDQLCEACRGSLTVIGGKWTLRIDKNTASSKTYTDEEIELRYWGRGSSSERKNSITVDYRYDPTEGTLLGSATREDSDSIAAIGRHSQRVQLAMVRDHDAAGKIADYLLGIQKYGEDRIEFSTTDFAGIAQDSIITVTISSPDVDQLFRVTSISTNGNQAVIEGRGYNSLIFGTTTPGTPPADPATDPSVPFGSVAPPAVPSGVTLSTGTRVQADGTLIAYIDGIYTAGARTLLLRVEMGEGANPGTWVEVAASSNGTFHVEPVKPGTNYTFRLTAVNTGGTSSAVTANITAGTDTTAPGTPQTPTADVFFGSVIVKCKQNASKAPDLAGFAVYRHTSNNSGAASNVGFAPCAGTEEQVTFIDKGAAYGTTYYYWTKAIDKNGNASGFSDPAGPVVTSQVVGGDLAAGSICASALFAAGVVDACAIGSGAVTAVKTCLTAISSSTGCLNACVVGANQIVDCAVTAVKTCVAAIDRTSGCLNVNTVGACQVIAGSLLACNIAAGTILACNIAAGTITGDNIAACTIATCNLAAGSVCADKIAAGTILACNIAAGTITGDKIAACTIATCNLAAGSVCADKIAAGTILACNIAAGTITGSNIAAGTITGSNIAAGTITSSKLLIAAPGAALNPDPAFLDASDWGAMDNYESSYCGGLTTVSDGKVGNGVLRSIAGASMAIFANQKYIPHDPGKTYRIRAWVRRSSTGCGSLYLSLRHYDANYSSLDENAGQYLIAAALPGTDWTEYAAISYGSDYPTARYMRVGGILNYQCSSGYHEIQDFRVEEVLPGTLIQDGAITTAKIYSKSLISDNWGASSGSCFDLCAGTFKLGGSSAPALEWNGSALTARGTICSCCGDIGGFLICNDGLYASQDCGNGMCSLACLSATDLCSGLNLRGYTLLGGSNYDCSFLSLRQYRNKAELYLYSDLCCNTSRHQDFVCITSSANTISGPNIFVCTSKGPAATLCVNTASDTGDRWALRVVSNLSSPAVYVTGHVCVGGTIGSSGSNGIQIGSNSSQMWSETNCAAYNYASLQLREAGLGASCAYCQPRLAFHWGGVVASQIGIQSSGRIAVLDNPGTGYENLIAKTIYSTGGICNDAAANLVVRGGTSGNTYFSNSGWTCIEGNFYAEGDSYLRKICNYREAYLCLYGGTGGFTCLSYGDCSSNYGFLRTVCNDNVPSVSIYKYLTTACCAIYGRAGGRAIIGDSVCDYGTMGYANCIGIFGCAGTNYGVYGSAPNACIGVFGYAVCYAGMFCATCYNGIAAYAPSGYAGVFCSAFPSIYANCGAYILGVLCYQTASQMSTRESKCDIALADTVLPTIRSVPVYTYRYCGDGDRRWNLGIMADDFACAVPWMGDGRGIPSLGSFAWKGVQELDQCVEALKARIAALEAKIAA